MYNADPDYTLGGELITDTAAHTGRFKSIFFKEDTQINTASHNYSGNSIDSETFLDKVILVNYLRIVYKYHFIKWRLHSL